MFKKYFIVYQNTYSVVFFSYLHQKYSASSNVWIYLETREKKTQSREKTFDKKKGLEKESVFCRRRILTLILSYQPFPITNKV